jgi:opacity protein-like surface antigen
MNKVQRFSTIVTMSTILLITFYGATVADMVIGVKAGWSFASINHYGDISPSVSYSTLTGAAICFNLQFTLNPVFWLRFEPMYVEKGTEIDWHTVPFEEEYIQENTYLTIPVNVKAVIDIKRLKPFLFAGLNLGYALKAEAVRNSDGARFDSDLKDFDLGLDFGGGTEISMNSRFSIVIEARYIRGLTDIGKSEYSSLKNHATLILTGVNFSI